MIKWFCSRALKVYTFMIDRCIAPFYLQRKKVVFDRQSISMHGLPYVRLGENSNIKLGANLLLNSRERSNPLALDHATSLITYEGASIIIGDYCSLSGVIVVSQTSVEIGDYTMIGANTRIYDTDFHPVDPALRRIHPTKGAISRPIKIGKNVFIGCHVHILKGVSIADDSVVPAGSIVYRDFPSADFR